MDKKRILASVVVFLILAILVYLQYRHWRSFDWGTFWSQTHRIKKFMFCMRIALVYLAYVMRALRWKIFLQPVRPKIRPIDLVSPMLVGFTGLALLGRAGEFIRPYLIARRADLPFSSQLAVWAVERDFRRRRLCGADGAGDFPAERAAVDSASGILPQFRDAGFVLIVGVAQRQRWQRYDRPQRRERSHLDGAAILPSVVGFGTPAGAESSRVRHGPEYDSRARVAAVAERCCR